MYPISTVFSMFIDNLCSCISFSKFHFYAEGLQIYLSGDRKDLDEMISALNEDLAAISRWSTENQLLLSLCKLQAILISNSAGGMVLSSFFLGTKKIPWYDAVTDLEVVIDGRLRFDRRKLRWCFRRFMPYYTECVFGRS
jgi:hypothetical protein